MTKLYTAKIEITPGDKKFECKREFQALNMDDAWNKAKIEAWRIGVTARVVKVEQV